MLLYLSTFITIILNAFMLFGLNSEIKISLTIGILYATLLFLYFLIYRREKNAIIFFSALAYWLLINFSFNVTSSVPTPDDNLLSFSFKINFVVALAILMIVAILLLLSISPFSVLLMSHSFLAAVMYFTGLALNYFIYVYLGSVFLLIVVIFLLSPPVTRSSNSKPFIMIWVFSFILFIANELAFDYGHYSFTFLQDYNFIANL